MVIFLLFIITVIASFSILIVKEIIIVLFEVFLRYTYRAITILVTKKVASVISDINIKILTFTIAIKIRFDVQTHHTSSNGVAKKWLMRSHASSAHSASSWT